MLIEIAREVLDGSFVIEAINFGEKRHKLKLYNSEGVPLGDSAYDAYGEPVVFPSLSELAIQAMPDGVEEAYAWPNACVGQNSHGIAWISIVDTDSGTKKGVLITPKGIEISSEKPYFCLVLYN